MNMEKPHLMMRLFYDRSLAEIRVRYCNKKQLFSLFLSLHVYYLGVSRKEAAGPGFRFNLFAGRQAKRICTTILHAGF